MTEPTEHTELERASAPGRALTEAVEDGRLRMSEILKAIGIDAGNPVHQAALLACEKYDLDPIRKEIIVIPRGGVYVTRDGYLRVAHRSGQLDGILAVLEEETPTHWEATATVYRKDMSHPFKYTGRYPKAGTNKQYGREMAIVRAERTALSRAFPVEGLNAGGDDLKHERDTSAITAEIESHVAVREWVAEHGDPAGDVTDAELVDEQPTLELDES